MTKPATEERVEPLHILGSLFILVLMFWIISANWNTPLPALQIQKVNGRSYLPTTKWKPNTKAGKK